jgi:hypothetical protein
MWTQPFIRTGQYFFQEFFDFIQTFSKKEEILNFVNDLKMTKEHLSSSKKHLLFKSKRF